jgi:hypothetical protein
LTNTNPEPGVFFAQTLAFCDRLFELSLQNLVVAHESTPEKRDHKRRLSALYIIVVSSYSNQPHPSGIIKPIMVAVARGNADGHFLDE